MNKAYGALTASCTSRDGWVGTQSFESGTAGIVFGNIIFGGIIGAAVDMGTGAAYKYPAQMVVSLAPREAVAPPAASLPSAILPKETAEKPARRNFNRHTAAQ